MNIFRFPGPLRSEEPGSEPPPSSGGTPPPPAVTAEDLEALRADVEALRAENAELQQTAAYWQKRNGGAPPPDEAIDPTPDLEAINAKGFKALKENGFLTRDEVDALVASRVENGIRGSLATYELQKRYPDIAKPDSEFFKTAAKRYKALEGLPAEERLTTAAELAEADMRRAGKYREPETDDQRLARILAQHGDGFGGRIGDTSDEMSSSQKAMAEAFGISPEKYAKRAREVGVNRFSRG